MLPSNLHCCAILAGFLSLMAGASFPVHAENLADCPPASAEPAHGTEKAMTTSPFSVFGNPDGATVFKLTSPGTPGIPALIGSLARHHLVVEPCILSVSRQENSHAAPVERQLRHVIGSHRFPKTVVVVDADQRELAHQLLSGSSKATAGAILILPPDENPFHARLEALVRSFWPELTQSDLGAMHTMVVVEHGRAQATVSLGNVEAAGGGALWTAQFLLDHSSTPMKTSAQGDKPEIPELFLSAFSTRAGLPVIISDTLPDPGQTPLNRKSALVIEKISQFVSRRSVSAGTHDPVLAAAGAFAN